MSQPTAASCWLIHAELVSTVCPSTSSSPTERMIAFMSLRRPERALEFVNDARQSVALTRRDLRAAVADAVEDFRQPADAVERLVREERQRLAEFHRREVRRARDAAALEQLEQVVVEA